jgi:uncharacterized protein YdaU (DUF1376 family)
MRHFAHNIGDYAAATAHLTFVEDAAYHRLLRRYYQDERPLPVEPAACERIVGARTKEERAAVRTVLVEFFTLGDDGWHQARADREIDTYHGKVDAARANGTKGGRPANRTKTNPVSVSVRTEKLTTPHSPSSDPNGSDADPASVVFGQGLKWMTKATGKPEANCRAQLGKWRKEIGDASLIEVLGAAQREGPIDAMAWLEKAVAARSGAAPRKPWEKPPARDLPPDEPWEQRMAGWRKSRFWNRHSMGPAPGEAGCRCPSEFLDPSPRYSATEAA